MTTEDPDAIVIGAGPNGLVAANLLADAGWSVTVLEAQPTPGGAVRSDTDVAPGFVHDTFSAFYPFAVASPVIGRLRLEEHGLVWRHPPAVLGNPMPGGSWALLHRDPEQTAAGLDRLRPGDGQAWLDLYALWRRVGPDVLGALLSPFPPVRSGSRLALRAPGAGGLALARMLSLSVRRLGEEWFGGEAPRLLLTGNALHSDLAPQGAGSGLFGWMFTMMAQQHGFPVPQGGAGRLTAALVRRLESLGGTVQCGTRVREVVVRDGRAVAVRTEDGTEITPARAVVADVVAPQLYGGLVGWEHLPNHTRAGMRRFEWDPATVKVDWALSGPVPWDPAPETAPGTVHIAHSVDELTTFAAQVGGGTVPSDPLLLLGQMTTADPTRSPAGTESLWAYTHVPQHSDVDAGTSGGDAIRGCWDEADCERMADRMQARIARFAPGLAERVVARRVLGPRQLQERDESLVGGAVGGGTANLHQQLVFRPTPGLGRAETPVRGLYLGSASAHPGGGVHGAPGANAARAALFHDRVRRWARRR